LYGTIAAFIAFSISLIYRPFQHFITCHSYLLCVPFLLSFFLCHTRFLFISFVAFNTLFSSSCLSLFLPLDASSRCSDNATCSQQGS
jgi:hypothetical protein